jgi:hypothetical protein
VLGATSIVAVQLAVFGFAGIFYPFGFAKPYPATSSIHSIRLLSVEFQNSLDYSLAF